MSKNLKYTPGPWRRTAVEGGWDGVCNESGMVICKLSENEPVNANLIAAAPEMYELLHELLEIADRGTISVTQEKVRSFLQRLEGGDAA